MVKWLPFLRWFTPIEDGWTPVEKAVTFDLNGWGEHPREPVIRLNSDSPGVTPHQPVKVSPLICFEDVFSDTSRDAAADAPDFLVNLTNDGWFVDSAEQWQHLANAVFRAVENGRPLVRAANNGITCWIDAHGRVQQIFRNGSGSEYGPGWQTMEIPLPSAAEKAGSTFYQRHGNWFAWICVLVTMMMIATGWKRADKSIVRKNVKAANRSTCAC